MFINVDASRIINLNHVVFLTAGATPEAGAFIALTTDVFMNNNPVEYIKGYKTEKERDEVFAKLQKAMKDNLISM